MHHLVDFGAYAVCVGGVFVADFFRYLELIMDAEVSVLPIQQSSRIGAGQILCVIHQYFWIRGQVGLLKGGFDPRNLVGRVRTAVDLHQRYVIIVRVDLFLRYVSDYASVNLDKDKTTFEFQFCTIPSNNVLGAI